MQRPGGNPLLLKWKPSFAAFPNVSFGQLGALANRGVEQVLRCPDTLQLCPDTAALALSLVSLVLLELYLHWQQRFC